MAEGLPQGGQYFAGLLRSRPLEELQVQAKQVQALTEHPGWQVLTELLGEAEKRLLRDLIYTPRVLRAEQYADATGEVRGLRHVDLAVRTLLYTAAHEEQKLRDADEEESRGSE